jgi:dolichol-phosphate mannosyltransferase
MNPELMLVMPVYNEQASVRKVVMEWFQEIENWTENFVFVAINDGSTDDSLKTLHRLREQLGDRLEIVDQLNQGHGQTCLNGYRAACDRKIPFVFQIDSDGQCDPQYFFKFWRLRESYDVIYGFRKRRDDGWRRFLASRVLWWTIRVFAGCNCVDANVPYRLMRTHGLAAKVSLVPRGFFLANVALAILLRRDKKWRHGAVRIHFRERYGGEPSVRIGQFGEKARELVRQLRLLKQQI